MASLQAVVISRERQPALDQCPALLFGIDEMRDKADGVGQLEIIGGEFPLRPFEDLTIGDATGAVGPIVVEIEDVRDTLYVHRQALKPVGQLGRDRIAFDATDLLKVGELADLHAVEPNLPAEPPGAQGGAFPIVLDEADVVQTGVDTDRR